MKTKTVESIKTIRMLSRRDPITKEHYYSVKSLEELATLKKCLRIVFEQNASSYFKRIRQEFDDGDVVPL